VVVEGHLAIRRLLTSGLAVRSVLVSPRGRRLLQGDLDGHDVATYVAEPEVIQEIVGFDLHRGALAVAARPEPMAADELVAGSEVVCVLEGVNDHENLGAVIRSAVGLGVDGLLLSPDCADPLYRRSIRVSMGWALTLPTARLAPWPGALAALAERRWTVAACTPSPAAPTLAALVGEEPARVAIVLGAEGPGLSAGAVAAANRLARIPMVDGVDSLNVAAAAAIAFSALGRAGRARISPPGADRRSR
jgi:tRNA G18 (ribose-2'-O)-methylase SpoU